MFVTKNRFKEEVERLEGLIEMSLKGLNLTRDELREIKEKFDTINNQLSNIDSFTKEVRDGEYAITKTRSKTRSKKKTKKKSTSKKTARKKSTKKKKKKKKN